MSHLPPATETAPATPADGDRSDPAIRLHQQAILSEFGVEALRGDDVDRLLQRAAELCAEGMGAEFCKALEYLRSEDMLLVRAGIGWGPDVIGTARIGADLASPAGFALKTGRPVISNHLENETRFRTPQLMAEHGIRRAINVIIANRDGAFGVLEVDDSREGMFEEADIAFMQGFANLLGGAIERLRTEGLLRAALARQDLLAREMSHRVKNSLTIVASLLALQAKGSESEDVRRALIDARTRVEAIAGVHDQLWRHSESGEVDLALFLETLCANLQSGAPGHRLACRADPVHVPADRAIPFGLLVNELVTNAIKYAYPELGGEIRIRAERAGDRLVLAVSDDGIGLPEDFDIGRASRSLGMRVVANLVRQLDGTIATPRSGQGAHFHIDMPLSG
ncbi:histidine kinase dimerization/phosphoacceptor domain -containing protein [Methylobacterium durans]|uniref:sensor histidine kinase n=1 Tax=Methylobacterium durans TaxID=2202825 RepID=UPI002AFDDDBC|nr:histidine kinase dimerization/phosphoacceptor domain -containing protein [Methylobacterium durans]MEA1834558.1 histidine kinase dimerization/phosphoacceptor domain -containing protein [Methylobacterium durans]